ncbi:MAG: hypothetical protein LAO06_09350 [Acidobacteriia bacterium]|nr:hypothetical protein [Terriglobia bacterium]
MKSIVRGAIAGLMLLGLLSAAAMPKNAKHDTNLLLAGGGPPPACDPNADPHCPPLIPPAQH